MRVVDTVGYFIFKRSSLVPLLPVDGDRLEDVVVVELDAVVGYCHKLCVQWVACQLFNTSRTSAMASENSRSASSS